MSFLTVHLPLLLLCLGPFLTLFLGAMSDLSEEEKSAWTYLVNQELPKVFKDTFMLLFGASFGALIIGFIQAFTMTFTNIPWKKTWHILFVLPMSFPLYVLAFLYVGIFDYAGFPLTYLRENFNFNLNYYFEIKSIWGAIIVFSLGLAPYVYMLLKNAFRSVPESLLASGFSLGKNRAEIVCKIILPLVKSWFFSCFLLIAMEVMADFGGVSIFNLKTFTTMIYTAWSGFFSLTLAARLSLFLIMFSLFFMALEFFVVKKHRYKKNENIISYHEAFCPLSKTLKILTLLLLGLLSVMGFILPFGQLVLWAIKGFEVEWSSYPYWDLIWKSFTLTFVTGIIIASVAVVTIFFIRLYDSKLRRIFLSLSLLGYGIPGNIIAVAVFLFFVMINKWSSSESASFFVGGSLILLVLAYIIRFFAVASRPFIAKADGLPSFYESLGDIYGKSLWQRFYRIYFPQFKGSFLTVLALVFLEVIKEMPIALMLRPFNFSTLSIRIYELTSEGEWERASVSAVILVFIGIIFVAFMSKISGRSEHE